VERPVRFGKRARGIKAIVLIVLLVTLGSVGGAVSWRKGLENRTSMAAYKGVSEAMEKIWVSDNWEFRTKKCQTKLNLSHREMCVYNDVGGKTTTLLFGDSHAFSPFDAIAEFNARIGVNTLMLHSRKFKRSLEQQVASIDHVINHNISKVFIIEIGQSIVDMEGYYKRLQYIVDHFRISGVEIFIVSENPALYTDIRNIIQVQPFRPIRQEKPVYAEEIFRHQEKYLNMLKRINGATIIDGLTAFCPRETCLLTDENGLSLYADDNHLSRWAGGRFLVEHVLKPYLTSVEN
jgi:hypothetical protein